MRDALPLVSEVPSNSEQEDPSSRSDVLDVEREFYEGYAWCLNPYPRVGEALRYLGDETRKLSGVVEPWQLDEVATNVFLLSGAVLNSVDDCLRGRTFQLPSKARGLPLAGLVRWLTETAAAIVSRRRQWQAKRWRASLLAGLEVFLAAWLGEVGGRAALVQAGSELGKTCRLRLPAKVLAEFTYFPSAFRKHDLTHLDVLTLGRRFIKRFPDREQPILIAGLRTAGTYFAPLLRALLQVEGYRTVSLMSMRPDKGLGPQEHAALTRSARAGCLAVIVDDAPRSGKTIVLGVKQAQASGFARDKVVVLCPVHPASRTWRQTTDAIPLAETVTLQVECADWHKQQLLDSKQVELLLEEYFKARQFSRVRVVASEAAERLTASLRRDPEEPRRSRLKRVYEVHLETPQGETEIRYVLAKSVGWGWLGYHAFLAGTKLAGFVPPVIGLRAGMLYSEWLPAASAPSRDVTAWGSLAEQHERAPCTHGVASGSLAPSRSPHGDREQWIHTAASYVAARTRTLRMTSNPLPGLALQWHHDSYRLLERALSKAYGGSASGLLMRPRIRHRLAALSTPLPTLIDGRMQLSEWVRGPHGPLKTDFEHHGMGKNELNVVDPAYDLAEVILQLDCSAQEEARLIERYQAESGDVGVPDRLFLSKLLAGLWTMDLAVKSLFREPPLISRQDEFNRQFVNAWHFLTVHAARYCGALCPVPAAVKWRSPLAVLDIDGVLDRRMFGFPHTTAAGIEALSMLHNHDFGIVVDTARSALEVQEYCHAYGFAGGVAENGSYVWNAVAQRGKVCISQESLDQLEKLRHALAEIPGVFLDHRYQHSIRAYTFEDVDRAIGRLNVPGLMRSILAVTVGNHRPTPLPALTVEHLLVALKLDRLRCFHTSIDTTIVAREVDKGTGLLALLDSVGLPRAETIAIGDSELDLPMFRVAGRSFSPAQIGCARPARALGCHIDSEPFQRGLRSIVRSLVHRKNHRCSRCLPLQRTPSQSRDFSLELLQAADWKRSKALLRAIIHIRAFQLFFR